MYLNPSSDIPSDQVYSQIKEPKPNFCSLFHNDKVTTFELLKQSIQVLFFLPSFPCWILLLFFPLFLVNFPLELWPFGSMSRVAIIVPLMLLPVQIKFTPRTPRVGASQVIPADEEVVRSWRWLHAQVIVGKVSLYSTKQILLKYF